MSIEEDLIETKIIFTAKLGKKSAKELLKLNEKKNTVNWLPLDGYVITPDKPFIVTVKIS